LTAPTPTENASSEPEASERKASSGMSAMNVGYTMLASILVGIGIGYSLDVWLDQLPWWTIGCSSFFIIAGLYQVVKEASK
jgi:F0F1-type ATP synthase assembly protein I